MWVISAPHAQVPARLPNRQAAQLDHSHRPSPRAWLHHQMPHAPQYSHVYQQVASLLLALPSRLRHNGLSHAILLPPVS
jgi:hypothetical protein